jgi:hypothetical protein
LGQIGESRNKDLRVPRVALSEQFDGAQPGEEARAKQPRVGDLIADLDP